MRIPHALQQRALFEMAHAGGSLSVAEDNLTEALAIAPYERTIQHTYANLKRMQANQTSNSLLKSKLRVDSRRHLRKLVDNETRTSHGYHTLILVLLDDLRDLLESKKSGELDQMDERQMVELVKDIELQIREGQQRFPDEERLLSAEVLFRELLEEDGRAIEVLRRAFDKNPRSEWIAVRMASRLVETLNIEEAKTGTRTVRAGEIQEARQSILRSHSCICSMEKRTRKAVLSVTLGGALRRGTSIMTRSFGTLENYF